MAKRKFKSTAYNFNTAVVMALIVGVVAGFVGGVIFARDRYIEKIAEISEMNMEKAVTIDNLHRDIQVLGASTHQDK